ncbi:MAG TPA: hypothetical protein DCO79_11920, partial [Spirochaeta sp.]|nr:hypothetical protein [Spirochaeta sp.]
MSTVWSEDAAMHIPLPEYPRPQLERRRWHSLNGRWDYSIMPKGGEFEPEGKILVPFAVESSLSGVQRPLLPDEELVYRKDFRLPAGWEGQRILLNFEAVDYECRCFINGIELGGHRGGYL